MGNPRSSAWLPCLTGWNDTTGRELARSSSAGATVTWPSCAMGGPSITLGHKASGSVATWAVVAEGLLAALISAATSSRAVSPRLQQHILRRPRHPRGHLKFPTQDHASYARGASIKCLHQLGATTVRPLWRGCATQWSRHRGPRLCSRVHCTSCYFGRATAQPACTNHKSVRHRAQMGNEARLGTGTRVRHGRAKRGVGTTSSDNAAPFGPCGAPGRAQWLRLLWASQGMRRPHGAKAA